MADDKQESENKAHEGRVDEANADAEAAKAADKQAEAAHDREDASKREAGE